MSFRNSLNGAVAPAQRAGGQTASVRPFRFGYSPELDGFRGVAVLLVVALHASFPWARGGGIGVDLFFVLSGFLITSLLLQEWARHGRISLRDFYLRRALRLIPALTVLILAYLGYVAIGQPYGLDSGLRVAGATALYLSNWVFALSDKQLDLLSHTWSLAIEEHFYLAWPLALCWLLKRWRPRAILWLIAGTIAAVTLARHGLWAAGWSLRFLMNSTFTRMDALLMGCYGALWLGWRDLGQPPGLPGSLRWCAGGALLVLAFMFTRVSTDEIYPFFLLVRFTLVPLLATVIILYLTREESPLAAMFRARPLISLGRVSYGIYLWHYPVFMLFRLPERWGWLDFPLKVGITALLVLASYHWVEQPFLQLKKRFGRV